MNKTINLQFTTLSDHVPDFIYKSLKPFAAESSRYHHQPKELVDKLTAKYSLDPEQIFLTAGIDEAILMFMRAHGKSVHIFPPTYVGYEEASLAAGANINTHNGLKKDSYHIVPSAYPYASMIILANPNNPFGITSRNTIESLAKKNPDAVVLVDEAYGDFLPQYSLIPYIKDHPNLVVLRSFSKGYGLAGIRIGYVIAHQNVIDSIRYKTHYFNISYLSVGAALTALENEDYFTDLRTDIILRKSGLESFLLRKNFKLLESKINCVVIKFDTSEQGILFTDYLASHNIIVSNGNGASNTGLDKSYVRIAIGTKEEIDILTHTINTYV